MVRTLCDSAPVSRPVWLAAAALIVALVELPRAAAQPRPGGPTRTILIRLEGRMGPPSSTRVAAASLLLQVGERTLQFQVDEARVLRGDRFGPDVLDELAGRWPSLFVRGPASLLQRLTAAGPGDRVVLTGYHRAGSREFALAEVKTADGAAAPR